MNASTTRPLGARVLVRLVPIESRTKGGLEIPDSAKQRPQEAIVVSVGEGGRPDTFCRICARALDITDRVARPLPVSVNDRILISRFAGVSLFIGEVEHFIVSEDEILGVIS